jgi:3',5'-cyclic AMP phosphodiesterase CpdA
MANQILILLSDLHIGLRPLEKIQTETIINKIGTTHQGVPVLIAGDLTDSATTSQFRQTRELLDRLARTNPVLAVPGNHDYAWKGNILRESGWQNWVDHLGSPLGWGRPEVHWLGVDFEPKGIDGLGVWEFGDCVFFGIDSGDPNDKVISARGFISEELARGLKAALRRYDGRTRIALMHHHPFDEKFFTKLKGADLLMDAVRENCELLLFGHEHKYGIWWQERGVPLTVSSHKSSHCLSGECMVITVMEIIRKAGTREVAFRHWLEVV